jgi:sodium transport system permease protein
MQLRHVKTVFLKEMLDTIRDRRTLLIMILVPILIMPALMLAGPILENREREKTKETVYKIVINGKENSPEFVRFLAENPKFKIVSSTKQKEDLLEGKINLVVTLSPGFSKALQAEKKTGLEIKYEGSQKISEVARLYFSQIIDSYSRQLVATRLSQRDLSSDFLEPIEIREKNIATMEQMNGLFLSLILPLLIIIWAIVGGMYTAIDVGAGEKERGTLEALLLVPPDRKTIVSGKFLAILTVAMVTIMLAISSMVFSMKVLLPFLVEGAGNWKFNIPMKTIVLIFVVALLVTCFVAALELAISFFARSFKEAQNYITPLYMIAMLPAIILPFLQTFQPPLYVYGLPIINAMLLFRELFTGNTNWQHIVLVLISNIFYILLSLSFALKTFNKENVLFRT